MVMIGLRFSFTLTFFPSSLGSLGTNNAGYCWVSNTRSTNNVGKIIGFRFSWPGDHLSHAKVTQHRALFCHSLLLNAAVLCSSHVRRSCGMHDCSCWTPHWLRCLLDIVSTASKLFAVRELTDSVTNLMSLSILLCLVSGAYFRPAIPGDIMDSQDSWAWCLHHAWHESSMAMSFPLLLAWLPPFSGLTLTLKGGEGISGQVPSKMKKDS